ncbi:hypothetical protein B0A79_23850 [Flavobacterium piscis]|uniref:hypothetical protein n=1 Tax=Flavobacterium piscis TaxID=1114874 RepID=UPI000B92002F|nr:hypothetical protein [Flavobacterium piscis]OXE95926.1 hypothetical protein B0A79_23850 [Flavobacterium piscis]
MILTNKEKSILDQSKLNKLFSTPVPNVYSHNTTISKPLYTTSSSSSSSLTPLSSSNTSLIYIINDYDNNTDVEPLITDLAECTDENQCAQIALFFASSSLLHIPNKIVYNLKKYTSKSLLREIDKDLTVAVEKCLIVISNLSSTYFNDKWKTLNSTILHEQTQNSASNYIYNKVIDCLLSGSKEKGPMIEIMKNKFGKETYSQGVTSRKFKITDTYYNAGLTTYNLTTPKLIRQRQKHTFKTLKIASDNIIAANLIELYSQIDYPDESEILKRGKELCKAKKKNKKGKTYTMRNRHKNEYWKDHENRTFIEDNILLYKYLTDNGIMIPIVGDHKSGGRVVDCFTLMPSWIRAMIKIDGEPIVEVDYACLHPNIAISLYGGAQKYITHKSISDDTGIDKDIIKIEHLSFFNKQRAEMKKSPLYNYYTSTENRMIKNIINEKICLNYKITSQRLFEKEVEIMTEVIRRLNLEGINAGYVYDALFTTQKNVDRVREVMNRVASDLSIYTTAK